MIKLAKTIGGSNGSPEQCACCGDTHFKAVGNAWSCCTCGLYTPTMLSLRDDVKNALIVLNKIQKVTTGLEDLVKK